MKSRRWHNHPICDLARFQVRKAIAEADGARPFVRVYFSARVMYVINNSNRPFNVNRMIRFNKQKDLHFFGSTTGPQGYIYEGHHERSAAQ